MKNSTQKIVLTQKGNVNKAVINMLGNCRFAKDRVYVGYNSGSGRFTSAHSAQNTVVSILEVQGYKYSLGNDAPRGGGSGDFVKVSKTALEFLKKIKG